MFTRVRTPAVVFGIALVGSLALVGCGARSAGEVSLAGGCSEALATRGSALASLDASTELVKESDPQRAAQYQDIADEAANELRGAADLGPCEDETDETGLVADLADLRTRYDVVLERTQARFDETAAQPADDNRGRGKGSKGGTKGD